mgnify:CR=1 FL=1
MDGTNDPLARAEALGGDIAAAADEIERTRRIPAPLLARLHEARLCRMLLPRAFDGDEVEPGTYLLTIEAVARRDASVAWNLFVANSAALMAALDAFAAASDEQLRQVTDEAQLVEWQGTDVKMVTGSPLNRKVTTRADLVFARQALKVLPKPDLLGRKTHPFQDGDMWR